MTVTMLQQLYDYSYNVAPTIWWQLQCCSNYMMIVTKLQQLY